MDRGKTLKKMSVILIFIICYIVDVHKYVT